MAYSTKKSFIPLGNDLFHKKMTYSTKKRYIPLKNDIFHNLVLPKHKKGCQNC